MNNNKKSQVRNILGFVSIYTELFWKSVQNGKIKLK